MGFSDIFEGVKRNENEFALSHLQKILAEVDVLEEREQIKTLTDNILAGKLIILN
jgi:hypothetical protein